MTRVPVGVVVVLALGAALWTPTAQAVQEPGSEYVFVLDDANSYIKVDLLGYGVYVDQSKLGGWLTLNLGDPAAGNPKTWNVKCVLGKCYLYNTEEILVNVPYPPAQIFIYPNNLRVIDMDVWYQDPNDWWQEPNDWPNITKMPDPNKAPDPNLISPGNPNDPTYNGPNVPTIMRWADLTGGPAISSGQLNSEVLYFARTYTIVQGLPDNDSSSFGWSKPFGPWTIQIADANYLDPSRTPDGPVQIVVDWQFWTTGSIAILGTLHIEAAGGKARKLELSKMHENWGTVTVDPAPIDPNRMGKYPDGTTVTMTATPIENKSFAGWSIYDPNFPGDPNHVTVDLNSVLNLTLDGDYLVESDFKCGSGVAPFLGMALAVLLLGVVIRRFT